MPGRDTPGRALLHGAILALFLLLGAGLARSQEAPGEDDLSVPLLGRRDPELRRALQVILQLAARKLAGSRCQQVFSDFKDGNGRLLRENLEATGQTGAGYLRWLIFFNGSDDSFCANRDIAAGTTPSNRLVRVCPRFKKIAVSDPDYAAWLLIHEELHSLGLGENPPASADITDGVRMRCLASTKTAGMR